MDINLIILELLSRIKILEQKVKDLEEKNSENEKSELEKSKKPEFPAKNVSDKYRALAEYLYERWEKKITLTYEELEDILEFKLPPTAYNIPKSYWANTLTHTYAKSWLLVGYKARVDAKALKVTFEKTIY